MYRQGKNILSQFYLKIIVNHKLFEPCCPRIKSQLLYLLFVESLFCP